MFRAATSLLADGVEIIVGLDKDDPTADRAQELLQGLDVRVIRTDRTPTVHHLFNELATHATQDFLLPFPDDYVVEKDWTKKLQLDQLPDTLGVAYLNDPMYPHFATFPIVSRRMAELQGFWMPPFFPFLFGDTWWNEVGVLSHLIFPQEAQVRILSETGHEHHYKNLGMWAKLFEKTRPMREGMAIQALREIFGDNAFHLIESMPDRSAILKRMQAEFQTPEFLQKWSDSDKYDNPKYTALKAKAELFMESECTSSSQPPPSITTSP